VLASFTKWNGSGTKHWNKVAHVSFRFQPKVPLYEAFQAGTVVAQGGTPVERKDLSIREFALLCNVSHTEVGRKMKDLDITGRPQGRGKPTLLNPAEQDRIAQSLFTPVESPPFAPPSAGGISIYQAAPLTTRGVDGSAMRYRDQIQMKASVQGFQANNASFRNALLGMASEQGRQLGHEMFTAQMSSAFSTYDQLQRGTGQDLGVVQKHPGHPQPGKPPAPTDGPTD